MPDGGHRSSFPQSKRLTPHPHLPQGSCDTAFLGLSAACEGKHLFAVCVVPVAGPGSECGEGLLLAQHWPLTLLAGCVLSDPLKCPASQCQAASWTWRCGAEWNVVVPHVSQTACQEREVHPYTEVTREFPVVCIPGSVVCSIM